MKKSVLIAPVLGILLVAAAGSVGGTVAWFSASSEWNTKITQFKVTRLDGNLLCTPTLGVGTQVTGAAGSEVISVIDNYEMTDASFDIGGEKLYTDAGWTVTNDFVDLGNETTALANKNNQRANNVSPLGWYERPYTVSATEHRVYYAVSFHLAFKYQFAADTAAMNLYFDPSSTIAAKNQDGDTAIDFDGATTNTSRGFRIAFIGASEKFSWAPEQNIAGCKHVTGTTGKVLVGTKDTSAERNATAFTDTLKENDVVFDDEVDKYFTWDGDEYDAGVTAEPTYNPAAYAAGTLLAKNTVTDGADGNAILKNAANSLFKESTYSHPNYLGQFTATSGAYNDSNTLNFTCVAWFEGTDVNVINAATMDIVAANLKFFTHVAVAA